MELGIHHLTFNFICFHLLASSRFGNLGCSLLAYTVRILPNISFLVILTYCNEALLFENIKHVDGC